MLKKLQARWKVNSWRLLLIICTFALGGSLCGYMGRLILSQFEIDNKLIWTGLYIIIISLLWPLAVIVVSLPMGQYRFFNNYIKKLSAKFGWNKKNKRPTDAG
jgi:hypothetical protein